MTFRRRCLRQSTLDIAQMTKSPSGVRTLRLEAEMGSRRAVMTARRGAASFFDRMDVLCRIVSPTGTARHPWPLGCLIAPETLSNRERDICSLLCPVPATDAGRLPGGHWPPSSEGSIVWVWTHFSLLQPLRNQGSGRRPTTARRALLTAVSTRPLRCAAGAKFGFFQ